MFIKGFNQFITEKSSENLHINYYAFDIDDNIINMPTVIHMDKLVGGKWIPTDVSTSEFAIVRTDPNWRIFKGIPSKAFAEFRDTGVRGDKSFLEDLIEAVKRKSYGPAWNDFIECLTSGSIFALITARGHEPETLRNGIEWIIDSVLTAEQLYEMYNNLLKYAYIFKVGDFDRILKTKPSENELIQKYLDQCDFVGVTAPSFGGSAESPEKDKRRALESFIDKINRFASNVGLKAKIGFSDDDVKNVKHIEDLFSLLNKEIYSNVTEYVVKNTSDPNNVTKTTKTIESVDPLKQSVISATQFGNMTGQLYPSSQDGRQDDFLNQHIRRTKYLSGMTDEIIKKRKERKKEIIDKKKPSNK